MVNRPDETSVPPGSGTRAVAALNTEGMNLFVWFHAGELVTAVNNSSITPLEEVSSKKMSYPYDGYFFDTEETTRQVLPLVPSQIGQMISLELDNQVSFLSAVATTEMERLHNLPEGQHPTVENWYRWYGCDDLRSLVNHFVKKEAQERTPEWTVGNHIPTTVNDRWLELMLSKNLALYNSAKRDEKPAPEKSPDGTFFTQSIVEESPLFCSTVEGKILGPPLRGVFAIYPLTVECGVFDSGTRRHRKVPLDLLDGSGET